MALSFLKLIIIQFQQQRSLAEKAIARLNNKALLTEHKENSNSIAIIMKHISRNMISRLTDFLTTDGEKAKRNCDEEFEVSVNEIDEIKAQWQKGWNVLFATLESLNQNDLQKTITIRSEEQTVMQAVIRQIVLLAKIIKGKDFENLSIPKGTSKEFNSNTNHK